MLASNDLNDHTMVRNIFKIRLNGLAPYSQIYYYLKNWSIRSYENACIRGSKMYHNCPSGSIQST